MSEHATTADDGSVSGDTTLAALAHASALVASFLGPLLFLILADDGDELVERNAKNAINFQIVVFAALFVAGILSFAFIGLLLFPIIGIVDVILVLIATVKANDGEVYSYPYTPEII
ncbi:DUF4870 domain-containing protein [Halorubrum ejinorense]|uniref:DUF4870 domain-containing protein n=1 Tax=Halorubrum ejinorense TaxID=425309 RepID=A0AAV3SXT8_9EURY